MRGSCFVGDALACVSVGHSAEARAVIGRFRSARRVGTASAITARSVETPRIAASWRRGM